MKPDEVKMEMRDLTRRLMLLIGNSIDEATLPGCDSFIEMDQEVIHFAGPGGDRYFRVTLTETSADQYFVPIGKGVDTADQIKEFALRMADKWLRAQYRRDGPWWGRDIGTTAGLASLIGADLRAGGWVQHPPKP